MMTYTGIEEMKDYGQCELRIVKSFTEGIESENVAEKHAFNDF